MIEAKFGSKVEPALPKYPYIAKHVSTGMVILFHSPDTGMVLCNSNTLYKFGSVSGGWNENTFEPFNEEVILKNK
jgi:hypothetical protein